MDKMDVTTRSIYGEIRSHYVRKSGDVMEYIFEIPANSSANIILGCDEKQAVMEAGKPLEAGKNGVISVDYANGKAQVKLGSGTYVLSVESKTSTGIRQVDAESATKEAVIYDLEGRKLNGSPLHRGVYIVNKKKVVL